MSRDLLAYGITTSVHTPGASAFVGVTGERFVIGRFLYAGQTLGYYTGQTAAAATLAAAMVPVPPQGVYINGPAPIHLLGANPIYVTTYLSQGYGASAVGY